MDTHQLDPDAALILGNAVHFLLADGAIDAREVTLLRDLAARHGASFLSGPIAWRKLAGSLKCGWTSDPDQARHCLAECFVMMVADEEIHEAERRAWIQLAVWFGASADASREMLARLERTHAMNSSRIRGRIDAALRSLEELSIHVSRQE